MVGALLMALIAMVTFPLFLLVVIPQDLIVGHGYEVFMGSLSCAVFAFYFTLAFNDDETKKKG